MRPMITAAILMTSGVVFAQSPPIKMGLWAKEMVTVGGPGQDAPLKSKSCVTPEEWQTMVENAQKPHEGCVTTKAKTANGYSFDTSCKMHDGNTMMASGTTTIKDSEHIVSDIHTSMTIKGQKRETTMHSTGHFLSSDCGSVKPGDPEVEDD